MIFVDACFGKKTPHIWMMRQAGDTCLNIEPLERECWGLLRLCKDYKKASEVTIQPVEILGVDAAILFKYSFTYGNGAKS